MGSQRVLQSKRLLIKQESQRLTPPSMMLSFEPDTSQQLSKALQLKEQAQSCPFSAQLEGSTIEKRNTTSCEGTFPLQDVTFSRKFNI